MLKCFEKSLVLAAIDNLVDHLTEWQSTVFDGDSWHDDARTRLLQARGLFHGQVEVAYDGELDQTMSSDDLQLLVAVQGITFNYRLPSCDLSRPSNDDDDSDAMVMPAEKGQLDRFIENFTNIHAIAADNGAYEADDWRDLADQAVEIPGRIIAQLNSLRMAITGSPIGSGEVGSPKGGESPVAHGTEWPEDLKWEEITITFVSDESVRIQARDVDKRFMYSDLGFRDKRKGDLPTSRWEVLRAIAEAGKLAWDSEMNDMRRPERHVIRDIAKTLREVFGLADNPFHRYTREQGYRPRFVLQDARPPHRSTLNENGHLRDKSHLS